MLAFLKHFFSILYFCFLCVETKQQLKASSSSSSGSVASFNSKEMEIDAVPSFDSAKATGGGGVEEQKGETDAEFATRLDNTIADASKLVTTFLGTSGESMPMDEDNRKRSRTHANAKATEDHIVPYFAPVWDPVHVIPRLPQDVQDHVSTFSNKSDKIKALNAYLDGLVSTLHPEEQQIVAAKTNPLDMFEALEEVLQSHKLDEQEEEVVAKDY
jgi:hypothetical protein